MNRMSITQEYYILATNETGNMPAMRSSESKGGIVAAALMDLLSENIITIEKKKITIINNLPHELKYLASLYEYLKEKPRTTEKMMNDYMFSTSKRIKQLTTELGESLLAENVVKAEANTGFFGNKTAYIPEKEYKEELIAIMKSSVKIDEEISLNDLALISILKETKNLNQYFSKYERDELKDKIKEIKKNPQYKVMSDMINYITDITACIFVAITASTSSSS